MKQMAEAISKYDIMGNRYVRLDELMALIRVMQRKHREAKEPGYMHQNSEQSISADLALSHLSVVLNKEEISVECIAKVMKTRLEREAKEQAGDGGKAADEAAATVEKEIERTRAALDQAEGLLRKIKDGEDKKAVEAPEKPKRKPRIPCRYTVWHYGEDSETTQDSFCFVQFVKGVPMFSNRPCAAMWFLTKDAAEHVAGRLGEGFAVVDMWSTMTKEERLLRAIYSDLCGDDVTEDDEDDGEWHGDGVAAEDEDWDGDGDGGEGE